MRDDWVVVPNHEFFEVTSCGRIRSVPRTSTVIRSGKSWQWTRKPKILSPCVEKNGYLQIASQHNGIRKKYLVHRLVGFAHVSGYEPGLTINHVNGNKLDNRAENLEWVSLSANTEHQWATGLVNLRGDNHPAKKLSSRQVVYIRRLAKKGISCHSLAVIAGVSNSIISLIIQGKRWNSVHDYGDDT